MTDSIHDPIYEELADAAECGELTPLGRPRFGDEARAEARALLMRATGISTPEDAARVALGEQPVTTKDPRR